MSILYWVGVEFGLGPNATEEEHTSPFLEDQRGTITAYTEGLTLEGNKEVVTIISPSGMDVAEIYRQHIPNFGFSVDIWDNEDRLGYGLSVDSIRHGNMALQVVKDWLRSIGITMHVAVYEWNPTEVPYRPPRPAGVDEMVSLDII